MGISYLPAIFPILTAGRQHDWLTVGAVSFVTVASFVSNLVENHKDGSSTKVSYWNRFNVLGRYFVMAQFLYLYYNRHGTSLEPILQQPELIIRVALYLVFLIIMEYDKTDPRFKKMYMALHCAWRIGIFAAMSFFLRKVIY